LLKPIDNEELEQAVIKFKSLNHQSKIQVDYNALKSLLYKEEKTYKKRFTIKVGQHLKVFTTENIECFYSENKGTYLHTNDPQHFYRISRKFFVNINGIKDIIDYTNSRLQLKLYHFSDAEIIVSRERVKDFKEWLGKG